MFFKGDLKIIIKIVIVFLLLLLIFPLLYFVTQISIVLGLGWQFLEESLGIFETGKAALLSLLAGAIALGFVWYIHEEEEGKLPESLSDLAGILGVFLALVSLALVHVCQSVIWLLLIAGLLCFYSLCVPVFDNLLGKMGGRDWEKAAVASVIGFMLFYWLGYESDILINTTFGVDPKHFSYSKYIAGLVILAPYIVCASLFFLVYFGRISFTITKDDFRLYHLNGVFSSYVFFVFSFSILVSGNNLVKTTAQVVDFNPTSICNNLKSDKRFKVEGVIYLDPKYDLVLVERSLVSSKENDLKAFKRYRVENCKKDTDSISSGTYSENLGV